MKDFYKLVSLYVSLLILAAGLEDDEMDEILEDLAYAQNLILKGKGWEEVTEVLGRAKGRIAKFRKRSEDPETLSRLDVLSVIAEILRIVTLWDNGLHPDFSRDMKRILKVAERSGYEEPYIAALSLLVATLFVENRIKELRPYIDEVNDLTERVDEEDLAAALLLEAASYINTVVSSDRAFKYAVRYGLALRMREGSEFEVLLGRLLMALDTILMRLAYEVRAGKVLPDEADWVEETNALLDWLEGEQEGGDLSILYVKLLQYLSLRSKYLKGDPFGLEERFKKVDPDLRSLLKVVMIPTGEGGDDALKA